jgi:molecular chaperone GrpE (heat shock protein)
VARLAAKSGDLEAESTMDKLRFLESKSRLSDDQARVLHRMRQLRNRAAHGELASDEVDAAAARAYSRVARALISVLDKLR